MRRVDVPGIILNTIIYNDRMIVLSTEGAFEMKNGKAIRMNHLDQCSVDHMVYGTSIIKFGDDHSVVRVDPTEFYKTK